MWVKILLWSCENQKMLSQFSFGYSKQKMFGQVSFVSFIVSVYIAPLNCSEVPLKPSNSRTNHLRPKFGRCVSFPSKMNNEVCSDNPAWTYHAAHCSFPPSLQEESLTNESNLDKRRSLPLQLPGNEKRSQQRQVYTKIQTQLVPHMEF